jgi:hypothetical protein
MIASGISHRKETSMSKWFETRKRAYLLDFQMPDSSDQMPIGQPRNLRDIDVADIVRKLHDHGVQALYTHAKDNQGNCYYDTAYGHKHTGIGDHDLMREFSEECRKVGMTILYYLQMTRERRGMETRDYAARDAQGKRINRLNPSQMLPAKDEFPAMCLNGPGRDYQMNCLRELSENYDFDGYWLDNPNSWMSLNPCYCETCRGKYREDTGRNLPKPEEEWKTPAWFAYLRYKRRINTIVLHELIATIRRANPNLTITHNGSGFQHYMDLEFCDADDYVTHEFHYNEGYGHHALTCRKNEALKRGKPFEIECWRFFNLLSQVKDSKMVRGYQVRPVPQLFTEMTTTIANGGFVQYYDQITPAGGLDDLSLKHMKGAFDQVAAREPFINPGQTRMRFASVLWSKQTEAFGLPGQLRNHKLGVAGAHLALMEKHIPHDLITERVLQTGDFGGTKVVVMPSAMCLSDKEADNLREFVRNGGGLVATYRTSLVDENGKPRENFLLADLFGCDYIEPFSYKYGFARFDEPNEITDGVPLSFPMTVWDKLQTKVRVRDGARALGNQVNPMRGMMMGHPPQEVTPHPAAIIQEVGKGRVVYFTQPLGACYEDYGHPDHRQLLTNAVLWAAGEAPPFEVDAPDAVEVVGWDDHNSGQQIIHLVNRIAGGPARTKASVITEIIPAHDIVVRVPGKVTKATLQPDGLELAVTQKDDASEIAVPKIDIHAMVVVDR